MPVRQVDPTEIYESQQQLGRDQWTYTSFTMKPRSRDVVYHPPEKPNCRICQDRGTIWVNLGRGKSRLMDCECQDDDVA